MKTILAAALLFVACGPVPVDDRPQPPVDTHPLPAPPAPPADPSGTWTMSGATIATDTMGQTTKRSSSEEWNLLNVGDELTLTPPAGCPLIADVDGEAFTVRPVTCDDGELHTHFAGQGSFDAEHVYLTLGANQDSAAGMGTFTTLYVGEKK